jgi:hypothetical protein
MRKIIVTVLAAALTTLSTGQLAAASHHRVRKDERTTSQPFRNANNSALLPVQRGRQYGSYSAPAGH